MGMIDKTFTNDERNYLSKYVTKHPRWRIYAKTNGINASDLRKTGVMKATLQALNVNVAAVLADYESDKNTGAVAVEAATDFDLEKEMKDLPEKHAAAAVDSDDPAVLMQRAIEAMKVQQAVKADSVDAEQVKRIVADYIAEHGAGPVKVVAIDKAQERKIDVGVQHKQFAELLMLAQCRVNVYIPGPAGSGKSHAARSVAQALDLPFYAHGAMEMRHELLGHVNQVTNEYVSQPFVEAFRNGGVCMLDEIDSWDANALLALNGALSDGFVFLPNGERVERHADCVILAGANTLGTGANAKYVGRNRMDAAALDRFVFLPWDYDTDLEIAISGDADTVKEVNRMRRVADEYGVDCVISPRASVNVAKLKANGFSQERAIELCILAKLPKDQWDIFGY